MTQPKYYYDIQGTWITWDMVTETRGMLGRGSGQHSKINPTKHKNKVNINMKAVKNDRCIICIL